MMNVLDSWVKGVMGDATPARGEKGGEKWRGDWSVFIVSVPGRK